MFAASKTDSVSTGGAPDDKFNYVTMLLHGDGTNGAQNNTFLDSSTNNFTITRNGNTTQGSFSPYGSNWSNYFNGTSALAFPSNSAFAFDTGAYTVEMWVFITGVGSGGYSHFFNAGNATGSFGFAIYSDYSLNVFGYGTGGVIAGSANDITPNTWQHIAVCRSSTSSNATKIYVNGVLKTTGTDSTNWTVTTTPSVGGLTSLSGYSTVGYISNCRVVKGTAVYTAAFTPPTAPLTAISGTSLLTCADNRFVDDSTNNFAITVAGTPSVQRFNPFGTSTAYSTSVIGGSGYFDGSGDYLTWPSGSSVAFGTGNFTVECWVYLGATPTTNFLFDFRDASNTTAPAFIWGNTNSGVLDWTQNAASGPNVTSTGATWKINTWYHIAYVRNGTTGTIYQNGVSIGSATDNTNYTVTPTTSTIGARYDSPFYEFPNGYISDVRIIKGTAVYTGAFTPPTAPLTAITNTSLLLNMTNGAIFDNAMMNDLETVGNAQISTSVKKYGTGSLAFDGTGDYLFVPTNQNMNFGSGNFTIEMWIYPVNVSSIPYLIDGRSTSTASENVVTLYVDSSQYLTYWVNGSARITASSTVSLNTWSHVAVVKNSGTTTMYLNGTSVGTWTDGTTYIASSYLIGQRTATSSQSWNGYIDDLRITKGYARYTTTFTPPTKALSDTGP